MAKKRIKSDFNMDHIVSYVYYKIVKKNKNINRIHIRSVIKKYFEYCTEDLGLGNKIHLGSFLGNLYLDKSFGEIKYDEKTDKIINTLPINRYETYKLWKEKPELKNIRYVRYTNEHSNGYSFKLRYEKRLAKYKNQTLYDFKFSTPVKDEVIKGVFDKKTDTYLNKYRNE